MLFLNKAISRAVLGALLTLPMIANVQAASYCRDSASDFFNRLSSNVCDEINTDPLTMEQAANTPFGYKSPDAGCDLGLSMPGLPSFGMNIGGLDSCKILQAVTGDMVDQANDAMQGGLDTALENIKGDTSIPSTIDPNEEIGKVVKGKSGY